MASETQQQQRRPPATRELSRDDLAAIVQEASSRQDEAIRRDAGSSSVKTIEDAYALARELGIPEQYVTEAASTVARQKVVSGEMAATRTRRLRQFVVASVLGVVGIGAALAGGVSGFGFLLIAVVAGTLALATLLSWLSAKMGTSEKQGVPPVPGTCRVCFRPAHIPESTFCEEHRYKGPSAT